MERIARSTGKRVLVQTGAARNAGAGTSGAALIQGRLGIAQPYDTSAYRVRLQIGHLPVRLLSITAEYHRFRVVMKKPDSLPLAQ